MEKKRRRGKGEGKGGKDIIGWREETPAMWVTGSSSGECTDMKSPMLATKRREIMATRM